MKQKLLTKHSLALLQSHFFKKTVAPIHKLADILHKHPFLNEKNHITIITNSIN